MDQTFILIDSLLAGAEFFGELLGHVTKKVGQLDSEGAQRTEVLEIKRGHYWKKSYQKCDQCSVATQGDLPSLLLGQTGIIKIHFIP